MLGRIAELFLFGLAPLLIGVAAMPARSIAAEVTLEGEMFYRERIALPAGAVATVQLLDVSLADVSAKVIAEQTIEPAGQVPIPFKLIFDPDHLKHGRTYSLQARIAVGEELWFITAEHHPFDPNTAPGKAVLRLTMVQHSDATLAPTKTSLRGLATEPAPASDVRAPLADTAS